MPPVTIDGFLARHGGRAVRVVLLALTVVLGVGLALAPFVDAQPKAPADFTMPKAESSPGFVTFSHAKHAASTCATCHAKDFKMKRGASPPVTLEAKQEGKLCGRCHDGKTVIAGKPVFAIDRCDACHKESAPTAAAPPPVKSAVAKSAKAPAPPKRDECLACHADKDLERGAPGPGRPASIAVDAAVLAKSRHAGFECVACHRGATAPHDERLPRIDCAGCHADAKKVLASGVHGSPKAASAGARRPTCAGCHGTHDVKPPALAVDACATCHQAQVGEWKSSIHGRSVRGGSTDAATCTSCHGAAHTLLANTEPQAPTYHLNLPRTCAQCHANPELAKKYGIAVGDVYKMFMDSIHGRAISKSGLLVAANCSDCHGAHDIKPKDETTSRVHPANVPRTCATCHAGVEAVYRESSHGKARAAGNRAAPVCIDCHSAHQIRRGESEGWQLDVVRECGTCHKESLRTYRDTYHGKVTALGFSRVARCSDCHSAHGVRPARDPASAVHAANLVTTCAKCHPKANENFVKYDPHANPRDPDRSPLLHYTWRFMTLLLVGTFGFFGLHTVLWGVRSLVGPRRREERPPDPPEPPPPAAPDPPAAPTDRADTEGSGRDG